MFEFEGQISCQHNDKGDVYVKIDRLLGYKNIFWSIIYKFKQSSERLMSFDECISGLDLPEEGK